MQQIQGEWAIIGVLGMVLFIVVIGKKNTDAVKFYDSYCFRRNRDYLCK